MSPSEQAKVCAGCGADVTNAQRMKDARGRYICAPCVAKLKAKKRGGSGGASAVASEAEGHQSGQGADLREFMAQAKEAAKNQCPSCGAFAQPGAVICLNCGYDARSQSQLQTKFGTAKAAKVKGGGSSDTGDGAAILDNGLLAALLAVVWFGCAFALPYYMAYQTESLLPVLGAVAFHFLVGFVFWVFWIISYYQRNTAGKATAVMIVTLILRFIGDLIALFYHSKEAPYKVLRVLATTILICDILIFIGNASGLTLLLVPESEVESIFGSFE